MSTKGRPEGECRSAQREGGPVRALAPATLRRWLRDGAELALLDVREAGQFSAAHLFCAVPLPYSRLELDAGALVPNRSVRTVLCDDGDGIGERARRRLAGLGYDDVHVLAGGPADWRAAGCALFEGVNTVSKAFGEAVEHRCHTPRLDPHEVEARIARGDDLVVVDGRPFAEYRKMNIPGSACCPNGELALRIDTIVPRQTTTIVVNCAGRTRSIVGAQTLLDLQLPNPVYALENGTQGWFLAGLPLEHGAARTYGAAPDAPAQAALRARTARLMAAHGVPRVDAATAEAWLADGTRTTYLFDVRSPEEVAAAPLPGAVPAPGGQLLQATDQWIGVRGARVLLHDGDDIRAGVVARWLRAMGHDAAVLAPDAAATLRVRAAAAPRLPAVPVVAFADVGAHALLDLADSATYRAGHAPGAVWSIRPRVVAAAGSARAVALCADDARVAALAAIDLAEAGVSAVHVVASPRTERTPAVPADADRIDFVAFAHGRHDGDRAAAELYLRWETHLLDRLTGDERALLPFAPPPAAAGAPAREVA